MSAGPKNIRTNQQRLLRTPSRESLGLLCQHDDVSSCLEPILWKLINGTRVGKIKFGVFLRKENVGTGFRAGFVVEAFTTCPNIKHLAILLSKKSIKVYTKS